MKNLKVINYENLLFNLNYFSGRKIIAMVKSNAYGHGLKEIVSLVRDKVDGFGVVNIQEGKQVRKLTDKKVLICSKVFDFDICKRYGLDIMVDNELDILKALSCGLKDNINLKINCGMNRFGVKSQLAMQNLNKLLCEKDIKLQSIYTHFPETDNKLYTKKCYRKFLALRSSITQKTPICFGGSGIFDYDFDYDILRLGIGMYGYEHEGLKKVMSIYSFVSKVFYAKKGEFVGYGKNYRVQKGGYFAVVPVGYGDGLRRGLSGKLIVKINDKDYLSVGNICMDAFFVKVDKTVKVGDKVEVLCDAGEMAKTCNTISYEILTGFSNMRGKTIIC